MIPADRLFNLINDARNAIQSLQSAPSDRRLSSAGIQEECDLLATKQDIAQACVERNVDAAPYLDFVHQVTALGDTRNVSGTHRAETVLVQLAAAESHRKEATETVPPSQPANRVASAATSEYWSNPASKKEIAAALGVDVRKLNNWKSMQLRKAGSRQSWQVRLDQLDANTRARLAKARIE